MGYSEEEQEIDFINRTWKIIGQYDDYIKDKKGKEEPEEYKVTLLINSFIGLLVMPKQKWFDYFPEDIINKTDWGIAEEDIISIKYNKNEKNEKNVKNIAKHLRNSVAHFHFKAHSNSDKQIESITFKDYYVKKEYELNFEAKLTVEQIKTFLDKFSSYMVKKIKQN